MVAKADDKELELSVSLPGHLRGTVTATRVLSDLAAAENQGGTKASKACACACA